MNQLELRAVTVADATEIAKHRYQDQTDQYKPYITWLETAIPKSTYLGWMLEHNGKIVAGAGMVLLEWGPGWNNPNPVAARIANVFTDPEHRRQGHARMLVEHCLQEAKARGITHLNLSSTDMARGLYESLGFEAAKNQMVRYG
jgi:GNAT superfamily N-acetyltransferase